MILERLAAIGSAAIVDGKDDPTAIDEILVERARPAIRHLPAGTGAAIMDHEDRIAFARLQRRRHHLGIKRRAILRFHRSKACLRVTCDIGRVGVIPSQCVLRQPLQLLAVAIGQIDLLGLVRVLTRHHDPACRIVHDGVIPPSCAGQHSRRAGRGERRDVELLFKRGFAISREVDKTLVLIHADNVAHLPIAIGERGPFFSGNAIQMAMARTFRPPQKAAVT